MRTIALPLFAVVSALLCSSGNVRSREAPVRAVVACTNVAACSVWNRRDAFDARAQRATEAPGSSFEVWVGDAGGAPQRSVALCSPA